MNRREEKHVRRYLSLGGGIDGMAQLTEQGGQLQVSIHAPCPAGCRVVLFGAAEPLELGVTGCGVLCCDCGMFSRQNLCLDNCILGVLNPIGQVLCAGCADGSIATAVLCGELSARYARRDACLPSADFCTIFGRDFGLCWRYTTTRQLEQMIPPLAEFCDRPVWHAKKDGRDILAWEQDLCADSLPCPGFFRPFSYLSSRCDPLRGALLLGWDGGGCFFFPVKLCIDPPHKGNTGGERTGQHRPH